MPNRPPPSPPTPPTSRPRTAVAAGSWDRVGQGADQLAATFTGRCLVHRVTGNHLSAMLASGVFVSTEPRRQMGITTTLGMSETSDQRSGGARSVFLRLQHTPSKGSGGRARLIWDDPGRLLAHTTGMPTRATTSAPPRPAPATLSTARPARQLLAHHHRVHDRSGNSRYVTLLLVLRMQDCPGLRAEREHEWWTPSTSCYCCGVDDIDRVRRFNRRWTEVLGLLDQHLLATDHSLTEARVIFELAHGKRMERLALRRQLGIDDSFLTRVLRGLEASGLVAVTPSTVDGRRRDLVLTERGRAAFAELDRRSNEQVAALLAPLSGDQRRVLGDSMTVITSLVDPPGGECTTRVRDLGSGDLGWVIQRHGEIYADEYGWSIDFEGLVAHIVADFWTSRRPSRERAWIADVDGVRAGCVFCIERDADCAQLRILLVEPWARGLGIGGRLVDDCIAFARDAGYPRIMLWTNDVLVSARRIYEAAGFQLVEEEPHHSFGHDLVGQNWELDLGRTQSRPRRR